MWQKTPNVSSLYKIEIYFSYVQVKFRSEVWGWSWISGELFKLKILMIKTPSFSSLIFCLFLRCSPCPYVLSRNSGEGAKDIATSLLRLHKAALWHFHLCLVGLSLVVWPRPAAWNFYLLFWVSYAQLKILPHYLLALLTFLGHLKILHGKMTFEFLSQEY